MLSTYSCPAAPTLQMSLDASGLWCCGAVWHEHWLQLEWSVAWRNGTIAAKEYAPVLLASVAWGRHWHGKCIHFWCGYTIVVSALRNYFCHDKLMRHRLRLLTFVATYFSLTWQAIHIRQNSNHVVDALSRKNLLTDVVFTNRYFIPESSLAAITSAPATVGHRLQLTLLEVEVGQLFSSGLAPATLRSYATA